MPAALTPALLLTLGLGTTIAFTSSHWLLAWMGLEINTLAILPLMARRHHPRATEAATKYFLIQATAASLLLFATCSNAWLTGEWHVTQAGHPLPSTLAILALALKLGLAPLHAWLPEVIQGLELPIGLVLSTWQKLAPLALLIQISPSNSNLLIILGVTSTFLGGWAGLNQVQIRKILAYSSIAHLGWMIIVLQFSTPVMLLALTIYILMTTAAFLIFEMNKTTTINQLSITWAKSPTVTALAPLILLSLGGLPPLTGFVSKWLILAELVAKDLALLATLIAFSALLSLYFYLRLSYAMTLTAGSNNVVASAIWRLGPPQHYAPTPLFAAMALMLLPLMPSMIALLL
uniref:NADH-ubiquinone oxidoreductase chain 2 n=1 Tax=Mullus barbatus TaxID=37007 RepID=Q8LWW2_9TELE|nr:NADH dehydrogenase subunit 2 [Mullus barbatus]